MLVHDVRKQFKHTGNVEVNAPNTYKKGVGEGTNLGSKLSTIKTTEDSNPLKSRKRVGYDKVGYRP